MGFISDLFNKKKTVDLGRKPAVRPQPIDKTGGYPANTETLVGLRDGTIAGLQHASPLARPPIMIPTSLVGVPTPIADDDTTQERLNLLVAENMDTCQTITKTKCTVGTSWIWPRYDSKAMKLVWELIPDETIESIGINPSTGEVLAIWTHEQITVAVGNGQVEYSERKRKITKDQVDIQWLRKGTKGDYDEQSYKNVFQSMPIPFPHGADAGEPRGHSVYGANLRTYKTFHDVMQNAYQILAELQPKLNIQTDNIGDWLVNNGFGNGSEAVTLANDTMFNSRIYLSKTGETSQMVFLSSDALKGHMDMLNFMRSQIIIGSDSPEIFWPSLAVGNMASTDIQKNTGVAYIKGLQDEDNSSYDILFNKSMEILSFVEKRRYGTVKTKWGKFDLMSQADQSTVFTNLANGLAALYNVSGITLEDAYYFVTSVYPDIPEKDAKAFIAGLDATIKHKQKQTADIYSAGDSILADGEGDGQ